MKALSSRQAGLLFAVATGLCWSILAIALKYSLSFASSGTIVWVRMLVAFVVLFAWMKLTQAQNLLILKKLPTLGLLAGLSLALNYFGFMKGVEITSASNTQIMIQMGPTLLIIIGIVFFKEKPHPIQYTGMLLAFLGFLFFYWDQGHLAKQTALDIDVGNLWILMAALTWALFASCQKILTRTWPPQSINLLIYATASLVLLPLLSLQELLQLNAFQIFFLIALGLNTIFAYGAFGEAMKRIPASHVSLIITLNPLLTLLFLHVIESWGWNFISPERIEWKGYLGAFLVVSGVSIAVSKKAKTPMK